VKKIIFLNIVIIVSLINLAIGCGFDQTEIGCNNETPDIKTRIAKFADQMEVLPLNVIAPTAFPFYQNDDENPRDRRFDLTLERYSVFYELKKFTWSLTQDEIIDCISLLDQASPKEKGIILTMLFLWEFTFRPDLRPRQSYIFPLYFGLPSKGEVPVEVWEQIDFAIKSCLDNTEIAFPALEVHGDRATLIKEFDQNKESLRTKLDSLLQTIEQNKHFPYIVEHSNDEIPGVYIPVGKGVYYTKSKNFLSFPKELAEQSTREIDEIRLTNEFTWAIDGTKILLYHGEQGSGNSSAKPKTVGEIAKAYITAFDSGLKYSKENQHIPEFLGW